MHHFEFDLTPADFRAIYEQTNIEFARTSGEWKKYRRDNATILGIAIIATLAAVWMLFLNRKVLAGIDPTRGAFIPLILGAGAAGMWWMWAKRRHAASHEGLRLQIEQNLNHPGVTHHCGHRQITLSGAVLLHRTLDEDLLQSWSGIREVSETRDFISFVRRDERFFVLPRRVVGDEQHQQALLTDARAWLAASGLSDEAIIVRHLRHHDEPCRQCRHNLRGLMTARCPECAQQITRENFPRAFADATAFESA